MKAAYSAHPALASKQLQRAEIAHQKHHSSQNSNRRTSIFGKSSHSIPLKAAAVVAAHRPCCSSSTKNSTTQKAASAGAALATDATQPKLPDRTDAPAASAPPLEDGDGDDDDIVDSVDAGASVDEFDHVQKRFSRKSIQPLEQQNITSAVISTPCTRNYHCSQLEHKHFSCSATTASAVAATATSSYDGAAGGDYGASSGLSSADSSPSASTTTSPLSTPTRFVPHCCHQQKAAADAGSAPSIGASSSTAAAHHQHPHHHHPHVHKVAGCKKLQKFDPRLGPSPYRQLLPIALCILSFATVFSILIVYMDTTEIRHQQFRLNMSRDYEMFGVPQDDPELIAFLREIQMKKYPMHFLKNRDAADQQSSPQQSRLNFSEHPGELTPEMAHYVSGLVGGKLNGTFIQSLPGALGEMMTAPWLAGTLNWAGVIVEPEPRRYFALRKQNALHSKLQVVHACVSQNAHPKEVTIHNEEAEVRINSLMDEETSWFFSRLKCFPLYTIMLACNRVAYDLLSLGVHGHELEILQTLPFDKIRIEVISVHLPDDHDNVRSYVQTVTKFLKGKSYKLQKNFGRNYFYQRINSTNRTRKKDILFKKPIQQL